MVRRTVVGFVVFFTIAMGVRGIISMANLAAIGDMPSLLLNVHLPGATIGLTGAVIGVYFLKPSCRASWWLSTWFAASCATIMLLILTESLRGSRTGFEYWVLQVSPWLVSYSVASAAAGIVAIQRKTESASSDPEF